MDQEIRGTEVADRETILRKSGMVGMLVELGDGDAVENELMELLSQIDLGQYTS